MTPSKRPRLKRATWLGAATLMLVALLALASCAYPKVSVRSARLDAVRLSGMTVDVYFDVENPNAFALPLEQVDWNLQLFGTRVGSGTSRMNKTLPAQRTTRVKMPITVQFRDVGSVAQRLTSARSISWDLDGTAQFKSPAGPLALDFAETGRWDNPVR